MKATQPRAPTIHEALRNKLGREPTHRELCDDVKRILAEGAQDLAARGLMRHQRGR